MKSSLFLEFPANEKQNWNWNRRTAASTGNPRSHSILIFFLLDIKKVNRSKKRSNIFSEYLLSVGKTEKWAESSAFSLELVFCFKVRRFSFLFIVFFVVVQFSFRFVSPTHRRKKKWKKKRSRPSRVVLGFTWATERFLFFLIFSYFFPSIFFHPPFCRRSVEIKGNFDWNLMIIGSWWLIMWPIIKHHFWTSYAIF